MRSKTFTVEDYGFNVPFILDSLLGMLGYRFNCIPQQGTFFPGTYYNFLKQVKNPTILHFYPFLKRYSKLSNASCIHISTVSPVNGKKYPALSKQI